MKLLPFSHETSSITETAESLSLPFVFPEVRVNEPQTPTGSNVFVLMCSQMRFCLDAITHSK